MATDDGTRFKLHVNPRTIAGRPFGEMPLEDVRPRHIRDLVRLLKEAGELAPRSIRNVYGMQSVKTEVPRRMPVHPTLAKILAAWRLGGWAEMMGRAPKADDLIVPNMPVLDDSSGIPLTWCAWSTSTIFSATSG